VLTSSAVFLRKNGEIRSSRRGTTLRDFGMTQRKRSAFSAIFALRRAIFNLTVERYCALRRSDIFCFRKMLMRLFAVQKAFYKNKSG
jgi:hypothetical protein